MVKKNILLFLFFSSLFFQCSHLNFNGQTQTPPAEQELIILHTNDLHGHPSRFTDQGIPEVGGFASISTFINLERKKNTNVLVLDAGDVNIGRPESNLFRAEPDILAMNIIGYDAMTLGNHEFSVTNEILRNQEKLASFPFLSANIMEKEGKSFVKPYIIKEIAGLKIAVIGITTSETKFIGSKANINNLIFLDEVETLQKLVNEVRNKVNLVIALVHLGIYDNPHADNRLRGSQRLASGIAGVDLIIDGHTHTKLDTPIVVNSIPIVQAWKWGLNIGKATFSFIDGEKKAFKWEAVPVNLKTAEKTDENKTVYKYLTEEIKEDQRVVELLKPYLTKVDLLLSEEIGVAEEDFLNQFGRFQETALGKLVADSMDWFAKSYTVDFALQNSGGIRNDLLKGVITKKVVYEILPFETTVVVLTMKGKELLDLFSYICEQPPGTGSFPQLSEHIKLVIDQGNKKCQQITINGKNIEQKEEYKLATTSYLAKGGTGFAEYFKNLDIYDTSAMQSEVLIQYIEYLGGRIKPVLEKRVIVENSKITPASH